MMLFPLKCNIRQCNGNVLVQVQGKVVEIRYFFSSFFFEVLLGYTTEKEYDQRYLLRTKKKRVKYLHEIYFSCHEENLEYCIIKGGFLFVILL